jgi:TolB protein
MSMFKRLLLGLGLCGFVGALVAAPAADDPKILFSSKRSGNYEIYLMNPDGSDAKNLTNTKAYNTFPAWSPDGKTIAFCRYDEGQTPTIWTMDADGKNAKQITKGYDRAPAWSHDGKKIAFCRHDDGNPEIYVMDADGSNKVNLTKNEAYDADVSWSPDGKRLAFTSNRGGEGFKIYVMDANGENVKEITKNPNRFGFAYPAWSPDGKRIAYADQAENSLELFICDPDGENVKQLSKLGGQNSYPAWSPGSKQILFRHFEGNADGPLYITDADGGNQKIVLKLEGNIEGSRAAWQPK